MDSYNELSERVDKGVAYLDARHPNWLDRIDTTKLDIWSEKHCVLAQLSEVGEYTTYLDEHWMTSEESIEMGFEAFAGEFFDYRDTCESLTEIWRNKIEALRSL